MHIDYIKYVDTIKKAMAHNTEFCNAWPWKESEITIITLRASIVLDDATSDARRMRRCASNLARINNVNGSTHFTSRAVQYDLEAQIARELLQSIEKWHRETPIKGESI
jgi:hypothetical protein